LNPAQLKEFGLISRDEYNKSCQTSESAFTPCDSCSMVQKSFRQCGDIVVAICQQQQIPSCLQKFRPQVSHLDWLSGNDVTRWAAEQHKDLQRISKLTATIKPLKDELSQCQEKSEKLEKRVQNFDRDLKREKDDRTALNKQYESKIKELESQHRQTLELEQQQKDLLEKNKHELESMLAKRKNELEEKQQLLKDMGM
jgi:predicted RNase H-like nuclease (RuvC/YqgF family)